MGQCERRVLSSMKGNWHPTAVALNLCLYPQFLFTNLLTSLHISECESPGQYRKKNVVYLGEKCSGFYQPKGDFSSL